MRLLPAVVAAALFLGCASASHDPSEDATLVCVQNETLYSLTAEVRDADTFDQLGEVYVSGFGRADRWIRTGGLDNTVMVSVDAVGFTGKWVPPAFRRILLGRGASLSLTVGSRGVTPFAHSRVNAYCPEVASGSDTTADSVAVDSVAADTVDADSAGSSRPSPSLTPP